MFELFQYLKYINYFIIFSFGDKDLDLRKCNPLHLRGVLEDKRFAKCQVVLLHASYPFSKEASYLASVYSQVDHHFIICIYFVFMDSNI
jgi:hypothetical protein